jgi:hypothetical protein
MLLEPIPKGFHVVSTEQPFCLLINYRTRGQKAQGCISGALVSIALVCFISKFDKPLNGFVDNAEIMMAISGILLVLMFVLLEFWHYYSVATFRFDSSSLIFRQSVLGFGCTKVVIRSNIKSLCHVRDDDSTYVTWSLEIIADSRLRLLSQQPIDRINWLGEVIARWAAISYVPATNRTIAK